MYQKRPSFTLKNFEAKVQIYRIPKEKHLIFSTSHVFRQPQRKYRSPTYHKTERNPKTTTSRNDFRK